MSDEPDLTDVEVIGADLAQRLSSLHSASRMLAERSNDLAEYKKKIFGQGFAFAITYETGKTLNIEPENRDEIEALVLKILTRRVVVAHDYAEQIFDQTVKRVYE